MRKRTKVLIAGGLLATAAIVPAIAEAGADSDSQAASGSRVEADSESPSDAGSPISGPDMDRASVAAIAYLGGGTVTDTEIGDEESYYEVEVTLEDGRQVDVQLDEAFIVVGSGLDGSWAESSGN